MTNPPEPKPAKADAKTLRAERVAQALRDNLQKRKAQARARATPPAKPPEPEKP